MKIVFVFGFAFLSLFFSCQSSNMQSANIGAASPTATPSQVTKISNIEPTPAPENDNFEHISPANRELLQTWLKTKTYLRPAVEKIDNTYFDEKYKASLDDNLKFLRETTGENGNQYYTTGDMNGDGKEDFAVLLVDTRAKKKADDPDRFALAIFNAPFSKPAPAYLEEGLSGISNAYITFDRDSKKHLYLGKFESDALCATYYSKKETYSFKDCMAE